MIDNSDYGIINSVSDYFVKGESYKEAYNEYLIMLIINQMIQKLNYLQVEKMKKIIKLKRKF